MTEVEQRAIIALSKCSYLPGPFAKRFSRDMSGRLATNPDYSLTPKQAAYLWYLCHRFRRQIADSEVLEVAERHRFDLKRLRQESKRHRSSHRE